MPRLPANPEHSAGPPRDHEFLYTLTCPVGGMVRYVGRTTNSLTGRFSTHMAQLTAKKQPNPGLLHWKQELHSVGLKPIIQHLGTFGRLEIASQERKWTRHYQQLGNPMLNIRNLLISPTHMGHNMWELNDIADKHNFSPYDVGLAADVCGPTIISFMSGAREVSRASAEKAVKFLLSLPAQQLDTSLAPSHMHGYLAYFLNEETKLIWSRS